LITEEEDAELDLFIQRQVEQEEIDRRDLKERHSSSSSQRLLDSGSDSDTIPIPITVKIKKSHHSQMETQAKAKLLATSAIQMGIFEG
jgi:hypothetical protein